MNLVSKTVCMRIGLCFLHVIISMSLESERRYPSTMGSINRKVTVFFKSTQHCISARLVASGVTLGPGARGWKWIGCRLRGRGVDRIWKVGDGSGVATRGKMSCPPPPRLPPTLSEIKKNWAFSCTKWSKPMTFWGSCPTEKCLAPCMRTKWLRHCGTGQISVK